MEFHSCPKAGDRKDNSGIGWERNVEGHLAGYGLSLQSFAPDYFPALQKRAMLAIFVLTHSIVIRSLPVREGGTMQGHKG